ncbi:MAG TPA: hypothetical protein VGQ17_12830 [Gemmatimonadales bacterium]|jgi:hypothetical protein|nr:hypothetical protein [Gemmatimonadales bacterium]
MHRSNRLEPACGRAARPALALLAASAVLITACQEARSPTGPGPGLAASISAELSQQDTPDQLAVAQAVPGFGGYFIDETGAPTVYLTDPSRRPEAAQALAGFLGSFGWTAADLKVRQADYDYLQLDAWYRRAWPQVLALTGAVSSDLDEGRNRLRFTGVDAAALGNIAGTLAGLGVPGAATVLQIRGPVRQVATLRDKVRPPHGGLQIQFFPSPASPLVLVCTLGFNAVKDGVQSFITNSHCSNVQGGITLRTDYYQSTRGGVLPNPDNFIGFEVDDPDYTSGGDCPLLRRCRTADASRAQYGAGQAFSIGRIARTTVLNTILASDDPAFLQVDDLNPVYRIASEQPAPVQGQVLNKVGRTTGWTQGQVVATCENVDITDSDITQLCQGLVGAYVDGGDSGSPVFGFNTDATVFLAGILWGSSTDLVTGEVQFIFSPFASIEREMGALTTADPLTTGGKKVKKPK